VTVERQTKLTGAQSTVNGHESPSIGSGFGKVYGIIRPQTRFPASGWGIENVTSSDPATRGKSVIVAGYVASSTESSEKSSGSPTTPTGTVRYQTVT
jgi:hypothetical protein